MRFLSKSFSRPEPIRRLVEGLGELEFFSDGEDSYWMVERPVLQLPPEFDFGAIVGTSDTIDFAALDCFKNIALQPDQLFALLPEAFFLKARNHFGYVSIENVRAEFFIKSLTVSNGLEYEFGLHSRSKDIFIELFVQGGKVTEVYLDEGCCSV